MYQQMIGSSDQGCTISERDKSLNLTQVLQPGYTLRLRPEPDPTIPGAPDRFNSRLLPAWYGATETGNVRKVNEDHFGVLEFADKTLFVVADGMGGHEGGEVASRIAVETVCRVVQENLDQSTDLLELVERAVQEANRRVYREGASRRSGMGTTLSVVIVEKNIAYIANVGDSRVYWIESGSISQITSDHSLVAKLVEAKKLTKEEARGHPKANLLFRSIGAEEVVKVDTFRVPLKKGGTLLLCTDGLWGEVAEDELQWVCSREEDSVAAGDWLIDIAKENGGRDNITAIVVKVR